MASETTAWDIFNALGNLCKAARDNPWAEAWCTAVAQAWPAPSKRPHARIHCQTAGSPKLAVERQASYHGISLVAGEGTNWIKFAETWVKFAGGAEAGGMVNDETETLAETSWGYCCKGVAQKDKRFNYGKFLHQEQKNVECFQGWRSKDTQKLENSLVIKGW